MKYLLTILLLFPTLVFAEDFLSSRCEELNNEISIKEQNLANQQQYIDSLKARASDCVLQMHELGSIKEVVVSDEFKEAVSKRRKSGQAGINWSDLDLLK